jgi:hypothetical protein
MVAPFSILPERDGICAARAARLVLAAMNAALMTPLEQLFDRHGADDGRQDEKTGDGVEQQQPHKPEQEFAPPRRKGIPNAKFYLVTQASKNLRLPHSAVNLFGGGWCF